MRLRSDANSEIIRLLRFLPGDENSEALYTRALERLHLSTVDYTSVREICRLAGYSNLIVDTLLIAMFVALQEGSAALRLTPAAVRRQVERFVDGEVDARVAEVLDAVRAGTFDRLIATRTGESEAAEGDASLVAGYRPLVQTGGEGAESYLYFHRHHEQVRRVQEQLEARVDGSVNITSRFAEAEVQAAMVAVLKTAPVQRGGQPIALNAAQILAVYLGLRNNFTLISGGPGTGKTAICSALLRGFSRLGVPVEQIRLAAPTGRAARRMIESLQRDLQSMVAKGALEPADAGLLSITSSTLHRLLEFEPYRNRFRRHRFHPLQARVLVVDEVSMIDIELMAALLEAAPLDCQVLLIGDPRQLPPVEVGDVLAGLLPEAHVPVISAATAAAMQPWIGGDGTGRTTSSGGQAALGARVAGSAETRSPLSDRVACLWQNYRSSAALTAAAEAVNRGETGAVAAWPRAAAPVGQYGFETPGVHRIVAQMEGTPGWAAVVEQWARSAYLEGVDQTTGSAAGSSSYFEWVKTVDGFGPEDLARPAWVAAVASLFARLDQARILTLVRQGPFGSENINRYLAGFVGRQLGLRNGTGRFAGLPILVLQNAVEVDLHNGDVGVLVFDHEGAPYGLFPSAEKGFRLVAEAALPEYSQAFAMTVHKSQGSEYDRVLIALPPDAEHRMLRRDLLYTALTRARSAAWIYGTDAAVQACVRQREPRDSGLRWW